MTRNIYDSISHADFLRLTLEAFSRQGCEVERSSDAGADAVLVSAGGDRIALLCKKYRSAFIGRPVLQQLHAAMAGNRCREGYLVTTTDCLPDAQAFAKEKGLELFTSDRTERLLRTAFGDEFLRTGRMPELGQKARAVPAPAPKPVTAATYEKVTLSDLQGRAEPERLPQLLAEPVPPPASAPPEPPAPAAVLEPDEALEPAPVPPPFIDELPEEVEDVESLEPASLKETRTIFCAECNQQTRVPTDQGVIRVKCSECGTQWLYQPEMTGTGEVRTTAVIECRSCPQQLNVPTNRGQLKIRCPNCGDKWLFTP